MVQIQRVGILQERPDTGPIQPVGVGDQGGAGLLLVKEDLVVGKCLPLFQGAAETGMGAQAEGHGLIAGVGHRDGGGKAGVGELLPHHQLKGVGVDRQSVGALPQLQLRPVLPLTGHGKFAGTGKAVTVHGDLFLPNRHLAVPQPTHDGEEEGIAPRPIGRISRPDVLQTVLIPVGHQLAAVGGHPGGTPAPLQFQFHPMRLLIFHHKHYTGQSLGLQGRSV